MFLIPLLHFHGTWTYSCVSWRLSSLLWLHRLHIELQVDGVSREHEGFINSSLHGDGLRPVTICPTSRPNVELIPPSVTKRRRMGAQH